MGAGALRDGSHWDVAQKSFLGKSFWGRVLGIAWPHNSHFIDAEADGGPRE